MILVSLVLQVVSTVLLNLIPVEAKLLSMQGKAKIAGKNWITGKPKQQFLGIPLLKGDDMSEAEVSESNTEFVGHHTGPGCSKCR